jgi:putative nucleotidyltransferase with HDIG domain
VNNARRENHAAGNASDQWRGRQSLSTFVSATAFLVPIALSVIAAAVVARTLPAPRGTAGTVGWWVLVLGTPFVVLTVTDRLARRLLPLAVLLKMTLVFPDQAPKRMAVARKAGSTRDLARRVQEAKDHGMRDAPVIAAEKILVLAGALNVHDRLTRGHSERVRMYTDLIADEMKLPQADKDRLRWSALLHDVGKVAVHPDILNKPGALDEAEWELIKNHPLEGAKLTAPLSAWLGQWADTMAEHHEKFDGSGYPRGLAGQEISLGARIVAVADAYDVMTAIRSYKPAMSPQAARAELLACAGTHFDPTVVRAFLDVSIGRVRVVAGPVAWLGSLPFIGNVPTLAQFGVAAVRTAAVSMSFVGAVAVGTTHFTTHLPVATPVVAASIQTNSVTPIALGTSSPPSNGTTGSPVSGSLGTAASSITTTTSVTSTTVSTSSSGGLSAPVNSGTGTGNPAATTLPPVATTTVVPSAATTTTTTPSKGTTNTTTPPDTTSTTTPKSPTTTVPKSTTTTTPKSTTTTAPKSTTTTTPKATTTTTTPKTTTTTTPKSTTTTVPLLCLLGLCI